MTAPAVGKASNGATSDRRRCRATAAARARRSIAAPATGRGGSVVLVLLVAALLVAAATGIVLARRQQCRTLYPGVPGGARHRRRVLAVRAWPAAFCGSPRRRPRSPLIKAIVDGAFDGIVVTDDDGRVIYANAAYLDLIDASDANDMRPVERAFIGDADASEAIYRLLKAAREGKRLEEEVRVAGIKAGRRAGCASRSVRSATAGATRG